jgi:squalene-hopene/tetraprenyl-beta-curcumene cyclase
VWDTAIAALAIQEATDEGQALEALRGLDWLAARQLSDEPGDWRDYRPDLPGGGWPFQYANHYYPDLDDTGMVGWAMHRIDATKYHAALDRAAEWIAGMQSKNGGFAAFDADNTCYYLNAIPFADHGALLDPPTADVTGRCVILLHLVDPVRYAEPLRRAIDYLKQEQEANGSWFGRWGTNYIYGTWSVLIALEIAGEDPKQAYIQRAVKWLKYIQNSDGGWGENNDGYIEAVRGQPFPSTPYSTAWALLSLLAAGEADSTSVRHGVEYLMEIQTQDGLWHHPSFTAPGFPRVFYLKYHGYAKFFPLWALARYRRLAAQPIE